MKKFSLLLLFVLSACGKAPVAGAPVMGIDLPDSACTEKNLCTNPAAPLTGYACAANRTDTATGCEITRWDTQTDPSCDPSQPNQVCQGGGWGSKSATYPCCRTVNGPGPSQ